MHVHKTEQFSQELLRRIKSAAEQSVIFGTASYTVGSQTQVTCQLTYATDYLIVKFRFGEMEASHVTSVRTLTEYKDSVDYFLTEIAAFARAFIDDMILHYNELPFEELCIALWEEAGIAIGGDW